MVAPTSDAVMMSSLSAGRDRRVVLSCSNPTVWGVAAPWGEPQAAVALFAVVVLSESAREDLFWNSGQHYVAPLCLFNLILCYYCFS